jgi:hypothetical protein
MSLDLELVLTRQCPLGEAGAVSETVERRYLLDRLIAHMHRLDDLYEQYKLDKASFGFRHGAATDEIDVPLVVTARKSATRSGRLRARRRHNESRRRVKDRNNRLHILNPGRLIDTGEKGESIDRLQQRLGAAFFFADRIAEEYHTTLDAVERYLRRVAHEHNLDCVERGLEQVGPGPHFIAWQLPNGMYQVKLYSMRPGVNWEFQE